MRQRQQLVLGLVLLQIALLGLAGLLAAVWLTGCAVRNLPGGGTAPATTFEQILAWNAALAQANDGIASNVIGAQQAQLLATLEAKAILVKQAAIAAADTRVTERLKAAATCGSTQAGDKASAAQLDAATAACARISGAGLKTDIEVITGALTDLNGGMLLGIKDPAKRRALSDLLTSVSTLINRVYLALSSQGVIL